MKLSQIESEASRLCGRIPEEERRAMQDDLIALCRLRWQEIRGEEPEERLDHAVWLVDPPLGDLFLDLYASKDERLDDALRGLGPSRGLALLALAEIEEGNEEEIRIIHDPMMLFDSEDAAMRHAKRISDFLRGKIPFPPLHLHSSRPLPWKGLALIAERLGRCDASSAVVVMGLLSAAPRSAGDGIERLRAGLAELGLRFLGVDDDHVRYSLHGRERKPMSRRQAADMLADIRAIWLS